MDGDPVLDALRRAVERAPDDVALRTHLAEQLLAAGLAAEAIGHAARLLAEDPADASRQALMRAAIAGANDPADAAATDPADAAATGGEDRDAAGDAAPGTFEVTWEADRGDGPWPPGPGDAGEGDDPLGLANGLGWPGAGDPAATWRAGGGEPGTDGLGPDDDGFDWGAAEQDLTGGLVHEPVETPVRLADVGGLDDVKAQLEAAFLAPLRHPELRARYGATLRGGLLLYGPPGCGKTHLARAVAGELGARFIAVSLADVLGRWVGQSEGNVAELFGYARRRAPVVVFLDEVDALGRSRAALGRSGVVLRGVVNQLLAEFDGIASRNDGVYVLGATNAPWDVDLALRRPGRFDRTLFVAPPDEPARATILRTHLADLPLVPDVDVADLARRTTGFSGADLALACRTAAQTALLEASRQPGIERPITQGDLLAAVGDLRPSTARWFEAARNVVLFADPDGEYAPLAAHLRAAGLL